MSGGKLEGSHERDGSDDAAAREAPPVGGVLLAAGESARMGAPKQLLRVGEHSLLCRAAEAAIDSVCRPVVVVLGARAERLRDEIAGLPVTVVVNKRWWAEGLASSIRTGVQGLENHEAGEDVEAVVLLVCDQPFVTSEVINNLVAAYRREECRIVASEYGGSCGVPALFSRRMFGELKALGGAEGAKHLIAKHAGEVCRVPFARGAFDIDTPTDYARLRAMSELVG